MNNYMGKHISQNKNELWKKLKIYWKTKEPLKKRTSFEIGGPAAFYCYPPDEEVLIELVKFLHENKIPRYIIGKGTNLLVSDKGIDDGVVIGIGDDFFKDIEIEGDKVYAGAGASLSEVCLVAAKKYLSGMEAFVGIPGSVGGAVCMNAGAFDGEMSNIVDEVYAITPDGTEVVLKNSDCDFAYRHSVFQKNDYIITKVVLKLSSVDDKDKNIITELMNKNLNTRIMKQPSGKASAGSFFKRPHSGFAGALIEKSMLKGIKVGDAAVSEKHCGFIINNGNAKAKDVIKLMEEIQNKVFIFHGVKLEPEVKMWGEF